MKPTPEQTAIIESSGNLRINAVAGSGKTTTLIEYAKARQGRGRILYLAFNRSVKIEAEKKFAEKGITNVQVETAHSLAHNYIIKGTHYKVKQGGGYKTQEIAAILGLRGDNQKHTEYVLANHINKFCTYFCNSDKAKVQELNYEDVIFDLKAKQFVNNFKAEIFAYTRQLLAKMDSAEIEVTHDFYLKKFQQQKPILPYDFILFDEGQDASEAMLDVFLRQPATRVIVGDTHQQIYGWRYAVNSLEKVNYPTLHLSTSFRFDNEIASLATRVLQWKNHFLPPQKVIINGYGTSTDIKTKATIARTNTALLIKAIELLIERQSINKVYFEGRFETYTYADEGASIYDVLNLYLGKRAMIKDPLVAAMQSMAELEEYIDKTEDAQLALIVEVVKKYGNSLPGYIKKIKESHLENADKYKADMIFSTVHRCKGMEYDEVTLANDFTTEDKIKKLVEQFGAERINLNKLSEEINLLYVAVTRTKNILNIPMELLPASKINAFAMPAEISTPLPQPQQQPPPKTYALAEVRTNIKNAYGPWTEELDEQLTELFCKRVPLPEIAKQLQRGVGAVNSRIKKLDLHGLYDI